MKATLNKKYNYNLEVLRGFAALIVVTSHIISHHHCFDRNALPSILKNINPPAHVAVMIFFVLSGYVIGISHPERLQKSNIVVYLKKRFIRIYPIYFLATALALIISSEDYSFSTLLANFTLTQSIKYEVIWENIPAWSLNYEILYYLLFIPISFFRISTIVAFLTSLSIGLACMYIPSNPIISGYAFGFCFWLLGLAISKNFKGDLESARLFPLLLYILSLETLLYPLQSWISKLLSLLREPIAKTDNLWSQTIITVDDLILLPFCFFIVLFSAGKVFKWAKPVFLILQLGPLLGIFLHYKHHTLSAASYVCIIYLVLATVFYFIKLSETTLKNIGVWFGSVSYGVYIIHFPILSAFGYFSLPADNRYFFLVKMIFYLALTIFVGWILEKKIQPVFKRILSPAKLVIPK